MGLRDSGQHLDHRVRRAHQRKRLFAVMSQYGITEDEQPRSSDMASGRRWHKDMSAEQLAHTLITLQPIQPKHRDGAEEIHGVNGANRQHIGNRAISEPEPLEHMNTGRSHIRRDYSTCWQLPTEFIDMPDPAHAGSWGGVASGNSIRPLRPEEISGMMSYPVEGIAQSCLTAAAMQVRPPLILKAVAIYDRWKPHGAAMR